MKSLPLMLMLFAISAFSQNVYTTTTPFVCNAASAHPITSFYQFTCRGMTWKDTSGNVLAEYFIYGGYNEAAVYATVPPVSFNDFRNSTLQITSFSQPANGNHGAYSFDWTTVDPSGVSHSGSASGTWEDHVICGGRGCYWHAPKLLTQILTINQ
jgi:hypothetical protein